MSGVLGMLLGAVLIGQAAPATAQGSDPVSTVEGVVITAKPTPDREALAEFVGSVSAPTGGNRIARWDRKICTSVIGLRQDYAQLLIDQVAKAAVAAGLEPGGAGCRPNMTIVATNDSDGLVQTLIKDNPEGFAKYDNEMTRGRKALKAFVESDAPVRWWHVMARVTADGQRYEQAQEVRVRDASRRRTNTRADFDRVLIVLDVKRIGVIRFEALADYIAMVGLAQVDPDAEPAGASTILNLFKDRDLGVVPAESLTEWDRTYLAGLYGARRDAPRSEMQQRDIVRTMADQIEGRSKKD